MYIPLLTIIMQKQKCVKCKSANVRMKMQKCKIKVIFAIYWMRFYKR